MSENGGLKRGVLEVAHHGDLDHGHDLATVGSQDCGTEDEVVVRVDEGLDEASGLVGLDGAGDRGHGKTRYANFAALLGGLAFAQADTAELGIDEDTVGEQTIFGGAVAAIEEIGFENAEVVVGDMGELGPAVDVAYRVDPGDVGLEFVVDGDESVVYPWLCWRREVGGLRCSACDPAATSRWEPITLRDWPAMLQVSSTACSTSFADEVLCV